MLLYSKISLNIYFCLALQVGPGTTTTRMLFMLLSVYLALSFNLASSKFNSVN